MGNKAVQSAIIDQLTPEYEKFEFAVKVLDTQIGRLLGDELALNHNQLIENSEYRQQAEELYTNLSFLRFARGITKSTKKRQKEIRDDLSRGIEKGDLDWYNNPKNSTSIYYSLLTSDKSLRTQEEGCFTGLKDNIYQTITAPLLYLGEEFAEYDEGERYAKAEEMIAGKLATLAGEDLIPPVSSIRIYDGKEREYKDLCLPWSTYRNPSTPFIVVETECF